jgi:HlyD family secretion protein
VTGFEVTGTLASVASDNLGAPSLNDMGNFKLSMMAPEGAEVKQGQPVLGFDTSDLDRRLEQKTAEADEAGKQIEKERNDLALRSKDERLRLAEAESRLRKSSLKLDAPPEVAGANERKSAEIENRIATREAASIGARLNDLERAARARIALLESKRNDAMAVVQQAQSAIAQMTVRAPRAGTVIYATDWSGEKKKVGDSTWKGQQILEIPDLTRMMGDGEIDEVDAGRVAVGQRVTLHLDAHPDDELHGTITRAGQTVQRKRGTRDPLKVLHVEIRLDRTDPATMRPGMRFTGTVELGRVKGAVLIPREAVLLGPSGPFVQRRGALRVEPVQLKLGRQNAASVEVLQGLAPGDRVLVAKADDEEAKS